ncbi:peptide deformylase [bacterium]|nr:peptide deformylase [bacterium]
MNKVKSNKANLLKIRIVGDKTLRMEAQAVTEFDQELRDFIDDLTYTMYETDGVGLAAPQVGVSKRIFVVDFYWAEDGAVKKPRVFINPEIVFSDGKITHEEGCLSVPEVYEKVTRDSHIKIKAQDIYGNPIEEEFKEFPAVVFQHEFDHLKGILFIDHLTKMKYLLHKHKINQYLKRTNANGENIQN